ncbi:hypothetical protein Tco_1002332 [Tanacetum coccineum]|uniref:Uncharacterized protein n=1 Tax=Tanacetum coccineum TaxID=301880 RepID=A0ABQ5F6J6_9ASTR
MDDRRLGKSSCVKKFFNFILDDIVDFWINPSLKLNGRFKSNLPLEFCGVTKFGLIPRMSDNFPSDGLACDLRMSRWGGNNLLDLEYSRWFIEFRDASRFRMSPVGIINNSDQPPVN